MSAHPQTGREREREREMRPSGWPAGVVRERVRTVRGRSCLDGCLDGLWLVGWLAGWLTGRLAGCLAAWLVGPWLADLMKVWPCGRPADGPIARCPRVQAASLLAAELAAPLGWLVARLLSPPSPGIRCEIMCPPCHPCRCLTTGHSGRESENGKGKGKRMEREQGNERERRGRGRARGRGEI